jgi:hypothetical protein
MLVAFGSEVRECRQCAEHCALKAQTQSDQLRQDFLGMHVRWLGGRIMRTESRHTNRRQGSNLRRSRRRRCWDREGGYPSEPRITEAFDRIVVGFSSAA